MMENLQQNKPQTLGRQNPKFQTWSFFSIKKSNFVALQGVETPPGSCLAKIAKHVRNPRQGISKVEFRLKFTDFLEGRHG
jgi:hypothetical protein